MIKSRKKTLDTPEATLRRFILHHPELELVESALSGVHFRYTPSDLDSRRPEMQAYLSTLNRELYYALHGQPNLFYQEAGQQFFLRISSFNRSPGSEEWLAIARRVVRTGFEFDAAMRASAFSH